MLGHTICAAFWRRVMAPSTESTQTLGGAFVSVGRIAGFVVAHAAISAAAVSACAARRARIALTS
jgi:hypothetical protein